MPVALDTDIYRIILENLESGVYAVDLKGTIVFWNEGAEVITGYLRQDVIGRCSDNLLMHLDEDDNLRTGDTSPLTCATHDIRPQTADLFILHKDGTRVPVRVRCTPVRDDRGLIIGAVESLDRIALRPGADACAGKHEFRDSMDKVTGVHNNDSLHARLEATLEDFRKHHVPFGVLTVSVNQLDEFRKLHGSIAARASLRVAGQTLAKIVAPVDVVGRLHSGLFVVVVTGCPNAGLETVAVKFRHVVSRTAVRWWGDDLSITISVGGTAGRETDTVAAILERSQQALS